MPVLPPVMMMTLPSSLRDMDPPAGFADAAPQLRWARKQTGV
jgi:hypothetical protein